MVSVAQRLEHWTVAPGVEGSNPFTHPIYSSWQKDRSCTGRFDVIDLFGPLAQLVEQLTLNQRVRSSSLRRPTKTLRNPTYVMIRTLGKSYSVHFVELTCVNRYSSLFCVLSA